MCFRIVASVYLCFPCVHLPTSLCASLPHAPCPIVANCFRSPHALRSYSPVSLLLLLPLFLLLLLPLGVAEDDHAAAEGGFGAAPGCSIFLLLPACFQSSPFVFTAFCRDCCDANESPPWRSLSASPHVLRGAYAIVHLHSNPVVANIARRTWVKQRNNGRRCSVTVMGGQRMYGSQISVTKFICCREVARKCDTIKRELSLALSNAATPSASRAAHRIPR